MPRKKSPESLQVNCITTVASLLHRLNNSQVENDFLWFTVSTDNNPFACYPSSVIAELLWLLGKLTKYKTRKTVRKEILRMLFCRKLDHLDLSVIPIDKNDFAEVLSMICPIATNLQSFRIDFKFLRFCTKNHLIRVLQTNNLHNIMLKLGSSMKNLTELCVDSICFDDFLAVIGNHCPNLIILEAASELITDKGLKSLCTNSNGGCKNLQKISLLQEAEGISVDGIQTLLDFLPRLTHIYGYNVGRVFEEMHKRGKETNGTTYRLEYFKYDGFESVYYLPEIILKSCPFVTCLVLIEANDDVLVKFGCLRFLTILIITTFSHRTTFANGILPLIRQAGSNVESLHLCLDVIDLSAINRYCPKLKRIFCLNVKEVIESGFITDTSFQHLETISFHAKSFITLSPFTIKMLLSNCFNLENLSILRCSNLTDGLLQEILSKNPLKKLKKLNLTDVDQLTIAGIEAIVNQESDLEHVSLPGASEDDVEFQRLKNLIKENNLNVILDRYFY